MHELMTIEIGREALAVLNVGRPSPLPIHAARSPRIHAQLVVTEEEIAKQERRLPSEFRKRAAVAGADRELDEWLGAKLRGAGRWDGDRSQLVIRPASNDEADRWRASLRAATLRNEILDGDDDWFVILDHVTLEDIGGQPPRDLSEYGEQSG